MINFKLSRFEGAMLGVAVGDALGAPLEFMTAEQIQAKHGTVRDMIGGGWLNVEPGEVTDDTHMTLAVAKGIIKCPDDPVPAIGKYFFDWYDTKPKDIGNTCAASLRRAQAVKAQTADDWYGCAEYAHTASSGQTAGNGALMRTVYPALYYMPDEAQQRAAEIARMTHRHDDSTAAVMCYTAAIAEIADADENTGTDRAKAVIERRMQPIRECSKHDPAPPSGYVIDSAVCAANAIRDTENFEDALVYAVNLGGDADTIGAITGGLAGAVYGAAAIPLCWINALTNEPNRDKQSGGNALAKTLIELAHTAYANRTGEK